MKNHNALLTISWIPLILIAILLQFCGPKEEPKEEATDFEWTTSSEEARTAFNEGVRLLDVGDNSGSRDFFQQALEKDPNFAMAYVYRSYSGSNEEFVSDTKKAQELAEKSSKGEKLLIELSETYVNDDADGRLALSVAMTDTFPGSARAWLNLGFEYDSRNEITNAEKALSRSIELDPNWAGGYTFLGNLYLFNEPKDFEKAKSNFIKAAKLEPRLAFPQINLGDAYRALDDLENAIKYYSKALEIDSKNFVALSKRGHANSFLGNLEEARQDYSESDKYNPYGLNLFSALSYLYGDDPDASLAALEGQIQQYDDLDIDDSRKTGGKWGCVNSCIMIALHYNKPDHFVKLKPMRTELDAASTSSYDNEQGKNNRAARNAYIDGLEAAMNGDYETAIAKAEENKSHKSSSTGTNRFYNYNFLMGYTYYKQEDYEKALEYFGNGSPNWVYNKYYIAKSYEANGNMDMAMPLYNEIAIYNFNGIGYALIRNEVREKVSS